MNPLTEFFAVFSDAFSLAHEWFPWLFPLFLGVLAVSMLCRLFTVVLSVPCVDPQDQDGTCPSGSDPSGSDWMPSSHPQYDPEHWYTGKD